MILLLKSSKVPVIEYDFLKLWNEMKIDQMSPSSELLYVKIVEILDLIPKNQETVPVIPVLFSK